MCWGLCKVVGLHCWRHNSWPPGTPSHSEHCCEAWTTDVWRGDSGERGIMGASILNMRIKMLPGQAREDTEWGDKHTHLEHRKRFKGKDRFGIIGGHWNHGMGDITLQKDRVAMWWDSGWFLFSCLCIFQISPNHFLWRLFLYINNHNLKQIILETPQGIRLLTLHSQDKGLSPTCLKLSPYQ